MEQPGPAAGPVPEQAPGQEPPRAVRRRPPWRWVVLAVVVAAVATVWAFGGFRSGSLVVNDQPGTPLALGPVSLTVENATASRNYAGAWTVQVHTSCQVSGDEPPNLALLSDEFFSMASAKGPLVLSSDQVTKFQPSSTFGLERDYLGPGLAPMPCVFEGTMPADYRPADGIRVAFSELQYGDDSVIGGQAEHWYGGNVVHRLRLPVQVVKQT